MVRTSRARPPSASGRVLLAWISLLGIVGRSATQQVVDNIQKLAPGAAPNVKVRGFCWITPGREMNRQRALGGGHPAEDDRRRSAS
ncbi:hypothetical protein AB0G90_19415 [Streptomyces coeruleorubidus]|nr:hypothetical protein [Streptomyces coeruleorubidus]